MNVIEIIEKWNKFCSKQSYGDSMIYVYDGDEEFIKLHYCKHEDGRIDVKDAVDALNELKNRGNQEFYAFKNDNVVWLTRTAIRDEDYLDSPIDWRLFKAWLEMEGVCI